MKIGIECLQRNVFGEFRVDPYRSSADLSNWWGCASAPQRPLAGCRINLSMPQKAWSSFTHFAIVRFKKKSPQDVVSYNYN